MGMKEKLDEKINRKQQEIVEFQAKMREAQAYIQALQDAAKLLPREQAKTGAGEATLRPGSSAHKAFQALQSAGTALHVTDILKAIGMTNTKNNRLALGGTLARYARNKIIFTKTAPNTFAASNGDNQEEPPEDFGAAIDDSGSEEEPE